MEISETGDKLLSLLEQKQINMRYKVISRFFSEEDTQEYKERVIEELRQTTLNSISETEHIQNIEVSISGGLHTLYLILPEDISMKRAMSIARELGWAERNGSFKVY